MPLPDWNLMKRLTESLAAFIDDALSIECVERVLETTQRLKLNVSVDAGQGYYFSKPVDRTECQALLSAVERHWAWRFSSPTLRAFK